MSHVSNLEKIPEVLRSLPWKSVGEYLHEQYLQISDGDRLLVAMSSYKVVDGKFTDEWTYDIASISIGIDMESGIGCVVVGNEYDFDCEFSDCDFYVKL